MLISSLRYHPIMHDGVHRFQPQRDTAITSLFRGACFLRFCQFLAVYSNEDRNLLISSSWVRSFSPLHAQNHKLKHVYGADDFRTVQSNRERDVETTPVLFVTSDFIGSFALARWSLSQVCRLLWNIQHLTKVALRNYCCVGSHPKLSVPRCFSTSDLIKFNTNFFPETSIPKLPSAHLAGA